MRLSSSVTLTSSAERVGGIVGEKGIISVDTRSIGGVKHGEVAHSRGGGVVNYKDVCIVARDICCSLTHAIKCLEVQITSPVELRQCIHLGVEYNGGEQQQQ